MNSLIRMHHKGILIRHFRIRGIVSSADAVGFCEPSSLLTRRPFFHAIKEHLTSPCLEAEILSMLRMQTRQMAARASQSIATYCCGEKLIGRDTSHEDPRGKYWDLRKWKNSLGLMRSPYKGEPGKRRSCLCWVSANILSIFISFCK